MADADGRYLLDTSALIALIENEDGAARVTDVLANDVALVPCVALVEALYIAEQEQGQAAADERLALIEALPIIVLWSFDADVVRNAARIKAGHRVSLGDALMAGFAIRYNATLLHKDPEFEQLADLLTLEALPYKV